MVRYRRSFANKPRIGGSDPRKFPGASIPRNPSFVAHAPIANAKRLRSSVSYAFLGKRTSRWHVAVLNPVAHFARRAAAHIARKICFCANQPAQANEFVRPKTSILHVTAPMNVDALRPRFERTDAIALVVVVRIATARPAQYRDAQFLQVIDGLPTISVDIRNRRVSSDPETAVHAGAKMLRKLPVKFRPHRDDFFTRTHDNLARCGCSGSDDARNERAKRHDRSVPDKSSAGNFREHRLSLLGNNSTAVLLALLSANRGL